MQKNMQINKASKQRRRILRRLWENTRRDKIMESRDRRMETEGDRETEGKIKLDST